MNGQLYITSDDFTVQRTVKGQLMCTTIPGISLLLFYSKSCKYCHGLIPIFRHLPGTIANCQFGIIDVGRFSECVRMSQDTIAPIKEVPYMLLYLDGKPFMRYKGPYNPEEIIKFVRDVSNKLYQNSLNNQPKTDQKTLNPKNQKTSIPEYTIGHPLKGENKVCYLDNVYAYDKS